MQWLSRPLSHGRRGGADRRVRRMAREGRAVDVPVCRALPGGTSALLRPGAAWMGKDLEVSVAPTVINMDALAGGRRDGAVVLVDWFLDEIVPGFGKTPFGRAAPDEPRTSRFRGRRDLANARRFA